jgi:hypothetical protein
MSDVLPSDILIIFLKAARSVSVILFASPQAKNRKVTRIKGRIFFPGISWL